MKKRFLSYCLGALACLFVVMPAAARDSRDTWSTLQGVLQEIATWFGLQSDDGLAFTPDGQVEGIGFDVVPAQVEVPCGESTPPTTPPSASPAGDPLETAPYLPPSG